MMLDLKKIEADPAKLRDGVWYEVWFTPERTIDGKPIPEPGEVPCVLIVPYGIAYDRAQDEERRPFLDKIRAGTITDDELRTIAGRVLGRTVFRGMRNISVGGEVIAWSESKAIELMTDTRWIRLREFAESAARNRAAAAMCEEAQAVKN
jgi:hypothetical protein